MYKLIYSFCFLVLTTPIVAQTDFSWWNEQHNWDGVTPWQQYIILSPAFMGPNALPVPEIKNGLAASTPYFEASFVTHQSSGDKTNNLFSRLYVPLYSERVGLNIQMVPFEHYKMNVPTRNERRARDFDGKGTAVGDVYIGTFIQLLKESEKYPDILMTINLKTASGSGFSAARYTDGPGYFFDLSVGKEKIVENKKLKSIRPYTMFGFNVYQTYDVNRRQNDSFIYGAGIDLSFNKVVLSNAIGGFIGYLRNGDSPMVYRFGLKGDSDKQFNYKIDVQQGILDFEYTSISIGFTVDMDFLNTVPDD